MTYVFWTVFALIVYAYIGYGIVIVCLSALARRSSGLPNPIRQHATLLIVAHNEADCIARKIENALTLSRGQHVLDIVVASDGSTDGTADIARLYEDRGVRVVEVREHLGKIFALNTACSTIHGDVVVFSDANSLIAGDAIVKMLDHFSDPRVGGVCGAIGVPKGRRGWLGRCEALYWWYDHALKKAESALGGAVSAQGSLYAVRRSLIAPLPAAVADDLVTSLRAVSQGGRLIFDAEAKVMERVSSNAKSEFGRRVRSTERGWRGLMQFPGLLSPFRTGFYAFQLFSHKVLRRLTPFLLIALMVLNLLVLDQGSIYVAIAVAQGLFYATALLGWLTQGRLGSWTSIPCFFVMGNLAMMLGIINVMRGKRSDTWKPARVSTPDSIA
jgi:cellulose synthase/poly-beta-1,6-N-acetylglucosamine synthase-like glycosyltransferase